ncbi:EAL domain-containing protein [Jatrophihabitans telluris]|uniref:EAL domain-containing protein n=1 Tax=Jatrophihabitans telluris TaxID=2038343 RepID=A0ABY4QWR2_9ACTN|nr:GGDEF domain-containing phosphodiesterase [Jatrophihabitans telluris]UQX87980.1 EAL domain-containing protein [Jatrophihabitans telluris]
MRDTEAEAPKDGATSTQRGASVPWTVLGTLLIVGLELALLTAVYFRGAPTRTERLAVAAVAGTARAAAPGNSSAAAAQYTLAHLSDLSAAGVPSGTVTTLRREAEALAADPGSPTALAGLRDTVAARENLLRARQHRQDSEAVFVYLALLVGASLGWMVWFRKLVSRHRALQRQVTEQQAQAIGEQRLAALVRNAADVMAVCDADSTITFLTPSVRAVLGHEAEQLVGRPYTALVHPADLPLFTHHLSTQRVGEDQPLRLRMHHADGRELIVEGSLSNLLADASVSGIVITIRDVTARVQLEERLTHQAFHDPLTGLANRQLFGDRLDHALTPGVTVAASHVVLFCDLDDFKLVNDSLGHGSGDEVLAVIAERMRATVGARDTVARLGGDEFAVLMEGATLIEAQLMAERLLGSFSEPIVLEGRPLTVRASIGLAPAVPGELTGEEVLRNADVAMYLAKDRGKSATAVYEPRLHEESLRRLQLRADLQKAVRRDELVLHFQPTVDLNTRQVVGFEALVRWQHPEQGLLGPVLFIPIAEESGLIVPLGSWVLRNACVAAASMQSDAHTPTMSVNVSSQQLDQSGFVEEVTRVLAETGLPPHRLCLEITESVVLNDLDRVRAVLSQLRALGIRIAIDDFGTGYSSLAYLSNLPVDVLKVDKSFVDRIVSDEQSGSLTRAIIAMSGAMKLATVAEGVEHDDQASWLELAACSYGQGYLWSKPVPYERATELLAELSVSRIRPGRSDVAGRINSGGAQDMQAAG